MIISDPQKKTMGFGISELDIETYMQTRLRLSRGTIVTRKSRIRIFLAWLQETHNTISSSSLENFFYYLQNEKGLLGSSLNTYFHSLYTLESYLVDRQLNEPFMKGFKKFKETEPDIIPLTIDEIRLLKNGFLPMHYKELSQTYKDFTIFLIDTGARFEEGQFIQCKSVDIIGQQLSYVQLKTGKRKVTHLEEPLLSILKKRTQGKNPEQLVFTNNNNQKINYPDYYKYLKKFASHVGIVKRVSPHILRHSYAQNSYDLTGDIYLTKDLLGQKNIKSTMRYAANSIVKIKTAQQMHPHVIKNVKPEITVDVVQKELQKLGIDKDDRFDTNKVRTAIGRFLIELTEAIKPSYLP